MKGRSKPYVFVTGGAGFVGRYVVEEFLQNGWRVALLSHRSRPLQYDPSPGDVEVFSGDVSDSLSMQSVWARMTAHFREAPRAVVHAAARVTDIGDVALFQKTNVESVRILGGLAMEARSRFVYVSSTDVYGLRDYDGPAEEALSFDDAEKNPYPRSKIASERWLRQHMEPESYAIVRPGAVWGVGDRTLLPRIVDFLRIAPWAIHFGKWRGANRWPLAHVRNVAAVLFLASTHPDLGGVQVNVLDSEKTSIDQFYRLIAETFLSNPRLKSITLPYWVGRAMGGVVTAISNVLRLDRPVTDPTLYAVKSLSHNLDFSNARFVDLMRSVGRRPFSKAEAVQELCASLQSGASEAEAMISMAGIGGMK